VHGSAIGFSGHIPSLSQNVENVMPLFCLAEDASFAITSKHDD
jgi:hypothetical protein